MVYLKKGGYTKKYSSYKPNIKQVKRIVQKEIDNRIEDKVMWFKLPTEFPSIGTWDEANIANPIQGDGGSERIGKKINVKSVEIKGTLAGGANESAVDDFYNTVRIIIGLWNCANNTPMATLETATAGMINSPVKKGVDDYALLEKKYLDKYIPFGVRTTEKGAGDGYTPDIKSFKYYKKFKKPIGIVWSDEGNTYPNHRLIMSCGSDSAAIPHPGFVAGYCIVHYEDA